jgi:hypothetical protein
MTTTETIWIEPKHDLLGISREAQVTFSNGKLFRISASGSLLELGELKSLADAGKIVKHSNDGPGRLRIPAAAFK